MSNIEDTPGAADPSPQETLADAISEALRVFYNAEGELAPMRSVTVTFNFMNDKDFDNVRFGVVSIVDPPFKPGEISAAVPLISALGRFIHTITDGGAPQEPPKVILN